MLLQCDDDSNMCYIFVQQRGLMSFSMSALPEPTFKRYESEYQNYFKHLYLDSKLKMIFVAAGPYGVVVYNVGDTSISR